VAVVIREWMRLEERDFCRDEIRVFILVPVWDKCIDVLGIVLKNDGSQKEQRATRTEPDLLNILRNFTQILADADTETVVLTSFCAQHRQVRVLPCSLVQSP
jgi:hypothetical protein